MKQSAGLVVWRRSTSGDVEVLLVHASGAYNRKAPFSIPKGEIDEGEEKEDCARRETREETGVDAPGPYVDLGHVEYKKSRKRIFAFGVEAPAGAAPKCASWEVDKAEFHPIERALELLHPDQRPLLERLANALLSR
jgi:predicted NUDIX family NTP pyrophosphohydrolase